jgi:hypothetical protein
MVSKPVPQIKSNNRTPVKVFVRSAQRIPISGIEASTEKVSVILSCPAVGCITRLLCHSEWATSSAWPRHTALASNTLSMDEAAPLAGSKAADRHMVNNDGDSPKL